MNQNSFIEIEHKFVVPTDFDQEQFFLDVRKLNPTRVNSISVKDTYFVLQNNPHHVFRHRYDQEIQQLTVKSVESDAMVRQEINLALEQSCGNQKETIFEFMKALGCLWSSTIEKDIQVAYFPDCEVVFYQASSNTKKIACIEFEAVGSESIENGIASLNHYESALGFLSLDREPRSLFELLLLADAPANIKEIFKKL